ncbi:MAG: LysM domain-containing protein [Acidimicrobiia bacterium]
MGRRSSLPLRVGVGLVGSVVILAIWYIRGRDTDTSVAVEGPPAAIVTQPPLTTVPAIGATTTIRPTRYVVKQGDKFYKIAYDFGITQEELLAANPSLEDPNDIKWGQTLVIPAISEQPAVPTTTTTIPKKPTVTTIPPDTTVAPTAAPPPSPPVEETATTTAA